MWGLDTDTVRFFPPHFGPGVAHVKLRKDPLKTSQLNTNIKECWKLTENSVFSPKSTKEDCPTTLADGGSAGMISALVKFPS